MKYLPVYFLFVTSAMAQVTAPRTLQAKLAEIVSIADFGALGDGKADDTSAIRAAVAAVSATGGIVNCPPGVYRTHTVMIPDGVSWHGAGATTPSSTERGCQLKSISAEYLMSVPGGDNPSDISLTSLNCDSVGTVGLYVGVAVNRTAHDMATRSCVQAGLVLDATQNSYFYSFENRGNTIGIAIVNGAGNNLLMRMEQDFTAPVKGALGPAYPIFVGDDTRMPQYGQYKGFGTGGWYNTIIRSILSDGGSYKYALYLQRSQNGTYEDLNMTTVPGTDAVIKIDSGSNVNMISRAGIIEGSANKPVIINDGFSNTMENSDIQVAPGCTNAIQSSSLLILRNNHANNNCFITSARSTAGPGLIQLSMASLAGSTAARPPLTSVYSSAPYFDMTLNRPVFWSPVSAAYVDPFGNPVAASDVPRIVTGTGLPNGSIASKSRGDIYVAKDTSGTNGIWVSTEAGSRSGWVAPYSSHLVEAGFSGSQTMHAAITNLTDMSVTLDVPGTWEINVTTDSIAGAGETILFSEANAKGVIPSAGGNTSMRNAGSYNYVLTIATPRAFRMQGQVSVRKGGGSVFVGGHIVAKLVSAK